MMWKKALSVHEIIIAILMIIGAFHQLRTHLRGGGGGSNLLYISIAYYMQKKRGVGWGEVQIACKNVYVINGRPYRST